MSRKVFFTIGLALVLIGIIAVLYAIFAPMKGDDKKIRLPQYHGVNAPIGHDKSSQIVKLLNPQPVIMNTYDKAEFQFQFKTDVINSQSIKIELQTDAEITVNNKMLDITPNKEGVFTYPVTLNTSVAGKFYIIFHPVIVFDNNNDNREEHSAPVGVLVNVVP